MKQATLEHELAVEQAHVDLVYARLEEATRSAQQVASEGANLYKSDRGSFVREEDGTGLYERDVFAFQAAQASRRAGRRARGSGVRSAGSHRR